MLNLRWGVSPFRMDFSADSAEDSVRRAFKVRRPPRVRPLRSSLPEEEAAWRCKACASKQEAVWRKSRCMQPCWGCCLARGGLRRVSACRHPWLWVTTPASPADCLPDGLPRLRRLRSGQAGPGPASSREPPRGRWHAALPACPSLGMPVWPISPPQLLRARNLVSPGDLVVVVTDVRSDLDGVADTVRSVQVRHCS